MGESLRPYSSDNSTKTSKNQQEPTKNLLSQRYLMSQDLEIIAYRQDDTDEYTHPTTQERDNSIKFGKYNGNKDG
jgi:hypothetical protein